MIIGIPKETKIGENRVAATPSGVDMLVEAGHRVLVENGAGNGSGFSDREYQTAGAELVPSAADAWSAEMVIKIKEPIEPEFNFLHDDLLLFTYLHLASPGLEKLTRALWAELQRQLDALGLKVKARSRSGCDVYHR